MRGREGEGGRQPKVVAYVAAALQQTERRAAESGERGGGEAGRRQTAESGENGGRRTAWRGGAAVGGVQLPMTSWKGE